MMMLHLARIASWGNGSPSQVADLAAFIAPPPALSSSLTPADAANEKDEELMLLRRTVNEQAREIRRLEVSHVQLCAGLGALQLLD